MLFAMGAVVVTTVGVRWLASPTGFVVSFALMIVTVLATLYAFSVLIHLLSDETRLEMATEDYIQEQFRNSLRRSTHRYVGARFMVGFLNKIQAQYSPIGPVSKDDYTKIPAYKTGRIVEVNLAGLYEFLQALPWTPHHLPEIVDSGSMPEPSIDISPEDSALGGPGNVIFKRVYGDVIEDEDEGVVFLKTSSFNEIEVPILSNLLVAAIEVSEARR